MKKCEFILYINGNIICQRYFNVKGFNKKSLNSLNLYDCINDVVGLIEKDLKVKSKDYLWKSFNPFVKQTHDQIVVENIFDNEDIFKLEIKVDDSPVIAKEFTGNFYQQRVRYSVDIRKIIPNIINRITETFTKEKLNVEYSSIKLA